jgi:three-Cys-motif partner protein
VTEQDKKTPLLYEGREQSLVKHEVLKQYLLRWALIVGRSYGCITYVDGFSGPWNAKSESLEDASFSIALNVLREAREELAKQQRRVKLRCYFIEENPTAFSKLDQFARSVSDAEVVARKGSFESAIPDILTFVRDGGSTFPFVFIDPTGWTGFAMDTIKPLLRLQPGEVLVNFMTRHIKRFIDAPEKLRHEEFGKLFGSDAYKKIPHGLPPQDFEDELVRLYMKSLMRTGSFDYSCSAMVLHPEMDTTHFHLIYATRHAKGVDVFKDAEKKAMALQEVARAEAQQRQRIGRTGQDELFGAKELRKVTQYAALRERYMQSARGRIVERLEKSGGKLAYDEAWLIAASRPLVWESDLKEWIRGWVTEGSLQIEGLEPRARVPKYGVGHHLVRVTKSPTATS